MSRHTSDKSCEVLLCNSAALTFGLFKAIAQELGSCKSRVDHAWGNLLPAGNVLQPTLWQDETQRVVGCALAPSAAAPIAAAAPPLLLLLLLLLLLTSPPMLPLALPARRCFTMGSAGDTGCWKVSAANAMAVVLARQSPLQAAGRTS
jgi:hypothetical protein